MRSPRYPCRVFLLGLFLIATEPAPLDAPPVFLDQWGTPGAAEGQFSQPRQLAVDALGNVYFSDTNNCRIQVFDGDGTFLRMWGWGVDDGAPTLQTCTSGCVAGICGDGAGQFSDPWGIVLNSSGDVFVADRTNNRIQKFDNSGNFLRAWGWGVQDGSNTFQTCTSSCQTGLSGSGDGQFDQPFGVAIAPNGSVYVVDALNQRIQRFSDIGAYLGKWGTQGGGDGQFSLPADLAFDAAGNVYVVDTNAGRVQKFDGYGTFLAKWGTIGTGDGQFSQPSGVAIDDSGGIYIGDGYNDRVQKFTRRGVFLTKWGTSGSGDGQFDTAMGVAISASGSIYVADLSNGRIQKFGGPWLDVFVGEPETEDNR